MRFMMLMIPLGYETAAPDVQLDPERVKSMMKYNEALKEAGVLIALDGLHPPSMGARVSFATGKPIVTDGPFTEAKEVLGGYWMIDVKSREEAIAWAKKCPASENEIIEIRQVQEMTDFSEEVQQAAKGFEELQKEVRTRRGEQPKPLLACGERLRPFLAVADSSACGPLSCGGPSLDPVPWYHQMERTGDGSNVDVDAYRRRAGLNSAG